MATVVNVPGDNRFGNIGARLGQGFKEGIKEADEKRKARAFLEALEGPDGGNPQKFVQMGIAQGLFTTPEEIMQAFQLSEKRRSTLEKERVGREDLRLRRLKALSDQAGQVSGSNLQSVQAAAIPIDVETRKAAQRSRENLGGRGADTAEGQLAVALQNAGTSSRQADTAEAAQASQAAIDAETLKVRQQQVKTEAGKLAVSQKDSDTRAADQASLAASRIASAGIASRNADSGAVSAGASALTAQTGVGRAATAAADQQSLAQSRTEASVVAKQNAASKKIAAEATALNARTNITKAAEAAATAASRAKSAALTAEASMKKANAVAAKEARKASQGIDFSKDGARITARLSNMFGVSPSEATAEQVQAANEALDAAKARAKATESPTTQAVLDQIKAWEVDNSPRNRVLAKNFGHEREELGRLIRDIFTKKFGINFEAEIEKKAEFQKAIVEGADLLTPQGGGLTAEAAFGQLDLGLGAPPPPPAANLDRAIGLPPDPGTSVVGQLYNLPDGRSVRFLGIDPNTKEALFQ